MTRLRPCDGCDRHVLTTERVCPFCAAPLMAADEPREPKVPPGLSRAQRFALAAAIAGQAALSACADDDESDSANAGASGAAAGHTAAGSGGSKAGTGGSAPGNGGTGAIMAVPLYGAPLAGAPGKDKDAGSPSDSGTDAGTTSDAGPVRDAGVEW